MPDRVSAPRARGSALRPFFAPPSRATWLRLIALVLPLAVAVVGTKLQKLAMAASSEVGTSETLRVLASDLQFVAFWSAVWVGLLQLARRRLRVAALVLLHTLNMLFLLWIVVEHGFHLATGSLLDWYMVSYAFANLGELSAVLASEVPVLGWAAVVGVAVYNAALPALRWAPWPSSLRLALEGSDGWRRPAQWAPLSAIAACLAVGLAFATGRLPDDIRPLRNNTFASLGGELYEALVGAEKEQFLLELKASPPLQIFSTPATQKHNLVFVVLESARARSCTPYNPKRQTTPNLARLAARGALVEQMYTVVPHTSKALVALHCGIYPKLVTPVEEAGTDALPARCLARLLRERGYATGFFQPAERSFERRHLLVASFGFEHFVGKEDLPTEGFEEASYFGYEDDAVLEPVLKWLDAQTRPFFLNVLTLTAHHNYEVPSSFEQRTFVRKKALNAYLNALAYTDRFLGKLFAGFEQRGLLDNTLFVILGDHGEGFGEHKRYQHDNVIYEEGTHIPTVLLGAGVSERGKRIDGLRQIVDVLPTVLEVLGYDRYGGDLPGKSLFRTRGHSSLYFSCWYKNRCLALRDGYRKTIYHYDRRGLEVFDLVGDPHEKRNIIDMNPLIQVEAKAAVEELLAWKQLTNARYQLQSHSRRDQAVRREPPESIQYPLDIQMGEAIRFLGYDLPKREARLGEPLPITYHFHALQEPAHPWRLFVHLIHESGKMINRDHIPVEGAYPVDAWQAGDYIADHHLLRVAPHKPPGEYRVFLGLWLKQKGERGGKGRRIRITGSGAPIDKARRLDLGTIRVHE